ncbi:hypothetical protein FACS1894217_13360 [Clostridia bacterium]|nr:hypothetical protein FACS1894217_13360 [Clostridia bacterium]
MDDAIGTTLVMGITVLIAIAFNIFFTFYEAANLKSASERLSGKLENDINRLSQKLESIEKTLVVLRDKAVEQDTRLEILIKVISRQPLN